MYLSEEIETDEGDNEPMTYFAEEIKSCWTVGLCPPKFPIVNESDLAASTVEVEGWGIDAHVTRQHEEKEEVEKERDVVEEMDVAVPLVFE